MSRMRIIHFLLNERDKGRRKPGRGFQMEKARWGGLTTAVVCLAAMIACGDNGNPAAPPPATTPPTTLPPNYSGTYNGIMLYNVGGLGEVNVPGRVTITHSGNSINFSNLVLTTTAGAIQYPLGAATLSGTTANGTHAYQSQGCGTMSVQTVSRFAGNLVNLTVELEPSVASCGRSRMVGELSR